MLDRIFTVVAGRIALLAGQPLVFILALLMIIIWGLTGPLFHYSDTWQLIVNTSTTIVTFLMVFLIQNSQNRDAAAMQAKLDELIRAVDKARGQYVGIEHMSDGEIEKIRSDLEEECRQEAERGEATAKPRSSESVERLRRRY
jgi:low affinity Fe/Cu permease